MFYAHDTNSNLAIFAARNGDNIIISGIPMYTESFDNLLTICKIYVLYFLNMIFYVFFGMHIIQNKNYSSTSDANYKLSVIKTLPLTKSCRELTDETISLVEGRNVISFNSRSGSFGIVAPPICSLYLSYLQQCSPEKTVDCVTLQSACLEMIKRFGTTIRYPSLSYRIKVAAQSEH